MSLRDFITQVRKVISAYGVRVGFRVAVQRAWERVLIRIGQKINYGERPLGSDWDVLVVLDACRADLFHEFAPRHPISDRFDSVTSKYSCASTSREWFEKGFSSLSDDEISEIHYVTENPYLSELDTDRFYQVEKLWELSPQTETGYLDSSTVTDLALRAYNESGADRFVVHYIPPHAPFQHCVDKYSIADKPWGGDSQDVWYGLQTGLFELDDVWNDYGKHLLGVLDEVERLVSHVNGKVIITADHGNALGEFGIYGHPDYVPIPDLKRVPWVDLQGQGIPYNPEELERRHYDEERTTNENDSVEKQLEALGYK